MKPGTGICVALLGMLAVAGCSTTASDGRRSLASGSINDDIKLGKKAHPQILSQYGGAYYDPDLTAYIDGIGQKLVAVSEYADIPFTFTVLDTDVVNAFALPGGYVYVSRGLLALAEDEAEIAGVIGHEIGHVTSRHGAERQGTAAIGQGLAIGAQILGGIFFGQAGAQLGQVAGQVGAAGFLGQYSQSQEFESDKLGVRYLARAGYDTEAMGDFLEALQTNGQLQAKIAGKSASSGGIDHFFASHPYTPDRVTRARSRSQERSEGNNVRNRERFLNAVDGMIFGQSPDQGYVLGQRFAHPNLRFEFEAPDGYQLVNGTTKVRANAKGRQMQFDLDSSGFRGDLRQYKSDSWVDMAKLDNLERLRLPHGYDGAIGFGNIENDRQTIQGGFAIVRAPDDNIYRFAMLSGKMTRQLERDLEDTAESLRLLSKSDVRKLKPQRVEVVTVRRGDTIDSLAERMDVENNPRDYFITMNGLDRGRELRTGDQVKIVVR